MSGVVIAMIGVVVAMVVSEIVLVSVPAVSRICVFARWVDEVVLQPLLYVGTLLFGRSVASLIKYDVCCDFYLLCSYILVVYVFLCGCETQKNTHDCMCIQFGWSSSG